MKTKDGYEMIKERVTIQDIANALGLSRTTVSKALNGAPNMPEKTVNSVLQMAKKLNYKQFITGYPRREEHLPCLQIIFPSNSTSPPQLWQAWNRKCENTAIPSRCIC